MGNVWDRGQELVEISGKCSLEAGINDHISDAADGEEADSA